MKVFVTQGHEQGIGLEVFFKASLFLSKNDLSKLKLLAYEDSVLSTLKHIRLPHKIHAHSVEVGGRNIETDWLSDRGPQSFVSLNKGMTLSEEGGVLYTLPTSKDQFPGAIGHTEYFRQFYSKPELGMFFSSPGLQVLLLSDHIPLSEVSRAITSNLITRRIKEALDCFARWHWPIAKVLVAGFNPHAGEGGIIGTEDSRIKRSIDLLARKFEIEMSGPLPGDTMLIEQKSPHDLLVYVYHDQGLGVFKGLQGFIGSNITLGLPYPRVSPDHGTSFKLYGKNKGDHRGCSYSLKEALLLLERIQNGKNSGHQSKGSQPQKY